MFQITVYKGIKFYLHEKHVMEYKLSETKYDNPIEFPYTILKTFFKDGREKDFYYHNQLMSSHHSDWIEQGAEYLTDKYSSDWVKADIIVVSGLAPASRKYIDTITNHKQ